MPLLLACLPIVPFVWASAIQVKVLQTLDLLCAAHDLCSLQINHSDMM